jgi:hypothetical protein
MVLQTFFSQQYKVGDTLKRTQLAATLKELLKMVKNFIRRNRTEISCFFKRLKWQYDH